MKKIEDLLRYMSELEIVLNLNQDELISEFSKLDDEARAKFQSNLDIEMEQVKNQYEQFVENTKA